FQCGNAIARSLQRHKGRNHGNAPRPLLYRADDSIALLDGIRNVGQSMTTKSLAQFQEPARNHYFVERSAPGIVNEFLGSHPGLVALDEMTFFALIGRTG